uniref:Uncharacterized protein n=1 Tax=Arundo donax TaxID=35708 RepID=A0A0A9ATP0_ARUDO
MQNLWGFVYFLLQSYLMSSNRASI